jgi:energy-coupling factor transport system permease protein
MSKRVTSFAPPIVPDSPLRSVDPRIKLVLSMTSSLAVMMPLERLLVYVLAYSVFLLWSKLMIPTLQQIWRLKYILIMLFIMDTLFVDVHLAVVVTIRIIMLAGVFTLFVSTTTPDELRLALERLGMPFRFAFSISMAFQSIDYLQQEWQAIREAQMARGIWSIKPIKLHNYAAQLIEFVALTVPAIVLTTRRAWAITEAASARGFDAPHRKPFHHLSMKGKDWLLLLSALGFIALVAFLRI